MVVSLKWHYIYLIMAKKDQPSDSYDPVASSSGSPSEVSINAEPPAASAPAQASSIRTNIIKCSGVLVVLIVLAILVHGGNTGSDFKSVPHPFKPPKAAPFQFRVHCPVTYYPQYLERAIKAKIDDIFDDGKVNEDLRRRLSEYDENRQELRYGPWKLTEATRNNKDFDPGRLYVVGIMSIKEGGHTNLRYCSLMRQWNGTCDDSDLLCVSPGAIFDFNVEEYADVIWINMLNQDYIADNVTGGCIFKKDPNDPYCMIKAKKDGSTDTFHSPTDLGDPSKVQKMRINNTRWPVSTHIHGLEIRPNFDGNPLSWFANNGEVGVGYMDLENQCYFDEFEPNKIIGNKGYDVPYFYEFQRDINELFDLNLISKVNRYPNGQNPGNLWYHDHAMRLTNYNVQNGLSGLYIIRSPSAEEKLPRGKYEKFVMRSAGNWDFNQSLSLIEDRYYRWRVLNNDFHETMYVRFTNKSDTDCNNSAYLLPFYILGADSSLFDKPFFMNGSSIREIKLGPAERIEVLIKATKNFRMCMQNKSIMQPHTSGHQKKQPAKSWKFYDYDIVSPDSADPDYPTGFDPSSLNLSKEAPFVNLSGPHSNVTISKTRMRPIMYEIAGGTKHLLHFKLNGHFEFGKGRSQNPEVGTTEDWWLINVSPEDHPIHVHLINFQVVDYLPMRNMKYKGGSMCDLYLAEFYLQALQHHQVVHNATFTALYRYFFEGEASHQRYSIFCNFYQKQGLNSSDPRLSGTNFINWIYTFEDASYEVSQEDVFDEKGISGIDLHQKYVYGTDPAKDDFVSQSKCEGENLENGQTISLFTCSPTSDGIPEWYRHWKDTALVPTHGAYKYRIRWAKSGYNPSDPEDSFFHVPVDQLREFPGFIYHCHILDHEDSEMMRSIMMQPPAGTNFHAPGQCNQFNWDDKADCLQKKCGNNTAKSHQGRNIENRLLTE